MAPNIRFFPVDNGDMTLVELESGRKILIDIRIRDAADDPDDETPDVGALLWQRLSRDNDGRLFVDAFLLSHPDEDHCRGLRKHFHLGSPADWSKNSDKILIREVWSSPVVFRRASRDHVLCEDACAFTAEARRRVQRFRDLGAIPGEGDRILVLGEDEDGKTDDLTQILVTSGSTFCGSMPRTIRPWCHHCWRPSPQPAIRRKRATLGKNGSSTILQIMLACGQRIDAGVFLTGGDAEVAIWERLWDHRLSRRAWRTTYFKRLTTAPGTRSHMTAGAIFARTPRSANLREALLARHSLARTSSQAAGRSRTTTAIRLASGPSGSTRRSRGSPVGSSGALGSTPQRQPLTSWSSRLHRMALASSQTALPESSSGAQLLPHGAKG